MTNLKCTIDGCERAHKAKGLCGSHYHRMRRHSDPVAGRTPNGDPLKFYQQVVLNHSGEECLFWPYARNSKGYGQVWIDSRLFLVSRAVCEEVNGPPPGEGFDAAHSCGKGHDGCVAKNHLSWKTRLDNAADAIEHGTTRRGGESNLSKLTEPQAKDILGLKGLEDQRSIAKRYGVSQQAISDIHRGRSWYWLNG